MPGARRFTTCCTYLLNSPINNLPITDLAPLAKLHLTYLDCGRTAIRSIEPLRGQPLRYLSLESTPVNQFAEPARLQRLALLAQRRDRLDVAVIARSSPPHRAA